jgi:hypothetical protein
MLTAIMLGAAALVCAVIVGIILYARRDADKGFMDEVKCIDPSRVPIVVFLDEGLISACPDIEDALQAVVLLINEEVGRELFRFFTSLDDLTEEGATVSFLPTHPGEPFLGDDALMTNHLTFTKEGAIKRTIVYGNVDRLPGAGNLVLMRSCGHELLHSVGLAHDDLRWSIMAPVSSPMHFELTKHDRDLLRAHYFPKEDFS